MFNFFHSASRAAVDLVTDALAAAQALPEHVSDTYAQYDHYGIPAYAVSAGAAQGAQALSSVANFAVAAAGSLANLAWYGLTTYGPPVAQGIWTGVKTCGPPVATAAGKGMLWVGKNAWEALKWGGNAALTAAQKHHVEERVLALGLDVLEGAKGGLVTQVDKAVENGLPALEYLKDQTVDAGKALATEACAGWELLYGKEIELGPLDDIGIYGSVPAEPGRQVLHAGAAPHDSGQDMEKELQDGFEHSATAFELADSMGGPEKDPASRGYGGPDLEFDHTAIHVHLHFHFHFHGDVCITGMPSLPMPAWHG